MSNGSRSIRRESLPKTIIAPSLLAGDFGRFADEARRAEDAGADWLHLDIMDGHFVPNISFGPGVAAAVKKCTRLPLDVHLMITHPQNYLEAFIKAGASSISVHIESEHNVNETLGRIRKAGLRAGLAINPETPLKALKKVDWSLIEIVLCMTVHPGFGGQSFIDDVLPKVRELACRRGTDKRPYDIEVDGGINSQTAQRSAEAGANVMVAGTSLFSRKDMKKAVEEMRTAIS